MSKPAQEGAGAVRVRGLERRFGRVRALRGLDLWVASGTTLAVFGPNGSGKTTLLRAIAGLLRPHAGSVELFGTPLPGPSSLRARIGMLAHESMLYADLTARENLAYYARLYKVRNAARVDELLALTELTRAADRHVRGFSRGMVQRLALARCVLHDPELVLMDEPFTGLDPAGANVLDTVLEQLRSRHRTVIFTTHDFARGLAAADAAAIVHRGRIAWHSDAALPSAEETVRLYAEKTGPRR